jgi:hypothetical protein
MHAPKELGTAAEDWDVLVAGGGLAGIAAAIAAARTGARTILIEQSGWLGGMGVVAATGLHSFFNIFGGDENVDRMRVVAGIAQELVDRTEKLGGGVGHVRVERGDKILRMVTPVEPETLKLAAARMCLESGVRLLLRSVVDEVQAQSGHVDGVVVWNKAGRTLVRAKQYVDCTGDGDLAAYAGAPYERFDAKSKGAYSVGFTFRLCNVDLQAMEADLDSRGVIGQLAHAVKPGTSQPDLVRLSIYMDKLRQAGAAELPRYFIASSLRPRELTYCNCINYGPIDCLNPDQLSAAEVDLRGQMLDVAEAFRRHVAGCEQCYVAGAAPYAGQRRTRAIRCLYELTEQDCTQGRQFEDQVGCYSFIDNPDYVVRGGGAYGIPYRALIPRQLDNVLIAGRMMTVDNVAQNSTRITGCCLICGQAAGTAAALSAAKRIAPEELDAGELRSRLQSDGVLLSPRPDPLPTAR